MHAKMWGNVLITGIIIKAIKKDRRVRKCLSELRNLPPILMTWVPSLGPIWWRKETTPTSYPLTSTHICIHRERKKAKKEMSQAWEKRWHSNGYYNYIPCVLEIKPSHKRFSKNSNFYGWKLQLGGERPIWLIVYSLSREAKTRTHGRDLKQKTTMGLLFAGLLALAGSSAFHLLTPPRDGIAHSGLDPLASVNHLKRPHRAIWWRQLLWWGCFFPSVSSFNLVSM